MFFLPDIPRDRFVLNRALNPLAVWAGMETNAGRLLSFDAFDPPPDSIYDRLVVLGDTQTDYPKGWRVQMIYDRWSAMNSGAYESEADTFAVMYVKMAYGRLKRKKKQRKIKQ